ncbi:MAG: hypothetical protein IJX92_04920 [Clostridia bacterium]|nr:hypothetical protein [Clostridia bacterium]
MYDLSRHPYFTPYTDKKSGVTSYVLTERVGTLQKHFYFAQPSVTSDGKYLFVTCCNPPARYSTLALVSLDPDNPFIRHFPNASPDTNGSLPCIDPEGDGVYYGCYDTVWHLSLDGELKKVITLTPEFTHNRPVQRLFTHASISCDNKYIALDMQIGGIFYVALGDIKTGAIKLLNKLGNMHDHAMFSPKDPNLFLIDQDWWRDMHTGEYMPINQRIWLMNTEGTRFEPLMPKEFYGRSETESAHDYWSADGLVCWTDYFNGAFECDIETREVTHVWKRPLCHSHSSADRQMLVGDESPYKWKTTPCRTIFYDRATNKEIDIFSALPYPDVDRYYHVDPHPQFCAGDSMIVSTTTVMDGRVDVAITPTAPLLEKCRKEGTEVVFDGIKPHERGSWVADTMQMM